MGSAVSQSQVQVILHVDPLREAVFVFFSDIPFHELNYPLVNIHKTMENHHFKWENPLFLWPFSIAMLNYQRVWKWVNIYYPMEDELDSDRSYPELMDEPMIGCCWPIWLNELICCLYCMSMILVRLCFMVKSLHFNTSNILHVLHHHIHIHIYIDRYCIYIYIFI